MGHAGLYAIAAAVLVAVGWMLRRVRAARRRRERQRAIATFDDYRAELEPAFLAAAGAIGKPRGLRWTGAKLAGAPLFAADRVSGELFALVGVTISFEAIEGGGMEEVEAVSNLRAATAVFVHRGGAWTTDGRAVFNLDPAGAVRHYHDTLAEVGA